MKRLVIAMAVCVVASPAAAQQVRLTRITGVDRAPAPAASQVNPEVWLYMQQLQRYDDPKQAVRRKAEQRAANRRARLASQRWFGFSPLRPIASPVPWMGTAAPMWVGNTWDPFRWVAPVSVRYSAARDFGPQLRR